MAFPSYTAVPPCFSSLALLSLHLSLVLVIVYALVRVVKIFLGLGDAISDSIWGVLRAHSGLVRKGHGQAP